MRMNRKYALRTFLVSIFILLLFSLNFSLAWGESSPEGVFEETSEEFIGPVLLSDEDLSATYFYEQIAPTEGWSVDGMIDGLEYKWDEDHCLRIRPLGNLDVSSTYNLELGRWASSAKKIVFEGRIILYDASECFYHLPNLESIEGLNCLDTSYVTDMRCMFDECYSLTSLDLSSFDTSNVTDMNHMFSSCGSLTSLDLSSFDTSNVTDMSCMFSSCGSLTSLDLSSFDTSNVTDMSGIFYYCYSLTFLDLSSFDTSNVTKGGFFSLEEFIPEGSVIKIGEKFSLQSCGYEIWGKCYNSNGDAFQSSADIPVGVADTYTTAIWIKSIEIEPVPVLDIGESVQLKLILNPENTTESIPENLLFSVSGNFIPGLNPENTTESIPENLLFSVSGNFIPGNPVGRVSGSSISPVIDLDENTGYLTATGYGTVFVWVDYYDDHRQSWSYGGYTQITVGKRVESIEISQTAKVVNLSDGSFSLQATVTPADSFNGAIAWSSTNTNVATVDADGRVTPVGVGTTMIVASAGSMTAQCTLTVISSNVDIVPVESVTIDRTIAEIVGKQTLQLSATSAPENATYKAIVWSSSNESVATVNNKGVVEAKGKGEATITASSLDGKKSATCKVTVLNPPVSLSFGDMSSTLKIGETISVSFVGAGDLPGATEELTSPTWINSDAGFAELSADGFSASLTGLSVGKVTISVDVIYDGQHISASKEIEVVWNDPESITLNESKIHSLVGDDSFSLVSTVMPESASGYQVLWSSNNPDVVSVEQNGRVDIHKSGYAVITARAGAVFATCEVNINAKSIPAATDSDLKGYVLIDDPDLAKELDGLRLRISNNDRKSASEVKSAAVDSLSNGTTLADLYDIDLIDGNDDVHPWDSNSKSVSVYIALTDELKKLSSSNDLIVHYLSDDLSKRETKKTWIEGENLIFDTTHFSTYAVTASPIENKSPVVNNTNVSGDPKGSLPKTGDSSTVFILIVTSAILALTSTLILATYRRRSLNQK